MTDHRAGASGELSRQSGSREHLIAAGVDAGALDAYIATPGDETVVNDLVTSLMGSGMIQGGVSDYDYPMQGADTIEGSGGETSSMVYYYPQQVMFGKAIIDLITDQHLDNLPEGTEVMGLFGDTKIVGVDKIDDDARPLMASDTTVQAGSVVIHNMPTDDPGTPMFVGFGFPHEGEVTLDQQYGYLGTYRTE
jgi:hypothetical protein